MPDEEAFFVVVCINEPAGDAVGTIAADFAGVGVEDIHAVDLNLKFVFTSVKYVDVRLSEDDEEVALTGIFNSPACAGQHSWALSIGMRPSLLKSVEWAS